MYHKYFGIPLSNRDISWVTHITCHSCVECFENWKQDKRLSTPFGIPMVWQKPKNYINDFYFYMMIVSGYNIKN